MSVFHVLCSHSGSWWSSLLSHSSTRPCLHLNHLLLKRTSPSLKITTNTNTSPSLIITTSTHDFASQTQFTVVLFSKPWIGQSLVSGIHQHKQPRRFLFHGRIMAHIRVVPKSHGSISPLNLIRCCSSRTHGQYLVQVFLRCGSAWNTTKLHSGNSLLLREWKTMRLKGLAHA